VVKHRRLILRDSWSKMGDLAAPLSQTQSQVADSQFSISARLRDGIFAPTWHRPQLRGNGDESGVHPDFMPRIVVLNPTLLRPLSSTPSSNGTSPSDGTKALDGYVIVCRTRSILRDAVILYPSETFVSTHSPHVYPIHATVA